MTPAELAVIRSRIEAASPGPWRRDRNNRAKIRDSYGDTIARIVHESNEEGFDAQCEADATFIVSARSDILALLAHIEAVETERDELRAKLAEAEATLADERGAVRAMLRERLDPLWSAMRTSQSEETQSYLQGRREEVIGLLTRLDAMLPAARALAARGSE